MVVLWVLFAVFVIIIFNRAWVSDDAFITLRTVDNFVNGYGLRWNIDERVQPYTHPLWMFLISAVYYFTREAFFTLLLLSLAISSAAVAFWMLKVSRTKEATALGLLAFMLSIAFRDYTTSGLENPLTNLILVIFAFYFLKDNASTPRRLVILSLLTSLAMVTRLDIVLLYLPALVYVWFRSTDRKRALLFIAAGQIPFIIWEAFSLFYYGFPFPNTYYAKLHTGIPQSEMYFQGLVYLMSLLRSDMITILIIVLAVLAPWAAKTNRAPLVCLSSGLILYLLYVLYIGGDFMIGRFYATAFFLSVLILSQFKLPRVNNITLISAVIALLTLMQLNVNEAQSGIGSIVNERAFYSPDSALISIRRGQMRYGAWAAGAEQYYHNGETYTLTSNIGQLGYYAPRDLHIIDVVALSDPLLSHLPARYNPQWMHGHFERIVPDGYTGHSDDVLEDSNLDAFNKHMQLITRGDLWSLERLQTIISMNLGRYDYLIDGDRYRYAGRITNDLIQQAITREGGQYVAAGLILEIPPHQRELYRAFFGKRLELNFEGDPIAYRVMFRLGDQVISSRDIAAGTPGIVYRVPAPESEFDNIWIMSLDSPSFHLEHLGVAAHFASDTQYPVAATVEGGIALNRWHLYRSDQSDNAIVYQPGDTITFMDLWSIKEAVDFTGYRQFVITNGSTNLVQTFSELSFPLWETGRPYLYGAAATIPEDAVPGMYDVLVNLSHSDGSSVSFVNEQGEPAGEYFYLTTIEVRPEATG